MRDIFAEPSGKGEPWASNPPFDRRHLRAIEQALRTAWNMLHKNYSTARELSIAKEERISHLLRDALNKIREKKSGGIRGYDCATFERPQVGAEIVTPDGKIRKPDIVFALSGTPRPGVSNGMSDGIYVECKIIQSGTKKNVAAYCRDGIHRFVEGSYAAWMRDGMMVAYVRSSQSLPADLDKTLRIGTMKDYLASDGELRRCTLTMIDPRVYISVHRRDWSYPDSDQYPGPIEIRHLWLDV